MVRNAEDMKFHDALNKITKSQFANVEKLYNSEDQVEGRAPLPKSGIRFERAGNH